MTTSRKYGKVTVRSNVQAVLQELAKAQNLPDAIRASIYSELEYAVFVEFGTYKMRPRAMLRRALPAIEAEFARRWKSLPVPPSLSDLLSLVDDVVDYGIDAIRNNTPVKSGDLKKSWKKDPAKAI